MVPSPKDDPVSPQALPAAPFSRAEAAEATLDALPAHLARLDRTGRIVFVNRPWREFAEANGGQGGESGLGVDYLAVCGTVSGECSDDAYSVADGIRAVLAGERDRFSLDYPCHSPKEERWFRAIVTPTPDGCVVMHLDVTDHWRARRELASSNADLERFAFAAAHDLQEPLRMVASYTQLLVRRFAGRDDADIREFAGFVSDGVRRMHELLGDLLEYSRVVHDQERAFPPVRAEGALERALARCRHTLERCGATVTHNIGCWVLADKVRLSQVFEQLLSNSAKYRREDEPVSIHIEARPHGSEWLITVRDNGIGFDPQYRERIFEIFQRLHKTAYPGTGVGLTLCRRIVERHRGRIWAESQPGQGATFFFTLPAGSPE